uniref:DNA-damage regulated autophagy modulator 2a n=1 Tax=Sinocyclocheilus grahami TaxID=75366 RepID=A0A672NRJ5_SINGR
MWWFQRGLCALPGALVIWSSDTFLISYATAVVDTGTEVPERCVFGFMLSISAFSGLGTMYVRYKQVQALISASESGLQLLNYTGLLMGIVSTVGMCFVANFQVTPTVSFSDLSVTGLTFGAGTLYVLVQTGMSYRMQPRFRGRDIFWARMAVGMWSLISIITFFISSVLMYDDLPGMDVANKFHWQPRERSVAHQVSAAAEWSLASSFICFFFTYIHDFQKITLRVQPVLQSNHLYDYPHYEEREHVQHGERSPLLAGAM